MSTNPPEAAMTVPTASVVRDVREIEFSFEWCFVDLSTDSSNPDAHLASPIFLPNGYEHLKWRFHVYPQGHAENATSRNRLIVYLILATNRRLNVIATPKIKVNVEYENASKETFTHVDNVFFNFTAVRSQGRPGYRAIFERKRHVADGSPPASSKMTKLTVKTKIRMIVTKSGHVHNSTPNTLVRYFGHLYETRRFWDVTIVVSGSELRAHKTILVARSPVFAAMFESDTKESQTNRIDIIDFQHEVIDEMLRYMYTNQVRNIIKTNADRLLAAADKYGLDEELRKYCEVALIENASLENAADLLILADLHGCDELKNTTIALIKTHLSAVKTMECFKRKIVDSRPDLLAAILFHGI